mmetsp:Transcript_10181/g.42234  ORF Transcript_10181/g.42234 Transcript_10181/m.42234 type:complete len:206 (-) Transcript_10181:414-1031(-)
MRSRWVGREGRGRSVKHAHWRTIRVHHRCERSRSVRRDRARVRIAARPPSLQRRQHRCDARYFREWWRAVLEPGGAQRRGRPPAVARVPACARVSAPHDDVRIDCSRIDRATAEEARAQHCRRGVPPHEQRAQSGRVAHHLVEGDRDHVGRVPRAKVKGAAAGRACGVNDAERTLAPFHPRGSVRLARGGGLRRVTRAAEVALGR